MKPYQPPMHMHVSGQPSHQKLQQRLPSPVRHQEKVAEMSREWQAVISAKQAVRY